MDREPAAQPAAPPAAARRELRLAVVCYGGVSLCVYMHGTTKELHRLVKASRLLALGAPDDGTSASERLYRELLGEARRPDGVRTDVVVDIVAGTSAGGINGVFLAKALAHNLPQDGLRELWFDKGDIKKLVRGPLALPIWLKAPVLLAQGTRKPPLRGKDMSVWLYDALTAMDDAGQSPGGLDTLMPEGHDLQLFVTMTDFYGYDRQIVLADPKLAHDRRHRHVFEFRRADGDDLFTREHNLGLAFAARATSCFPGAFPPVSVPLFRTYLPHAPGDMRKTFFRLYELAGVDVERTFFVDGGVLDNRPFGHAIAAIRERRAEVEVDRRLLYLEPDPGGATAAAPGKPPATIAAVLGAVSGIPRREPILDELLEVARLNERVGRIRDVVKLSFAPIAQRIDDVLAEARNAQSLPDAAQVGRWQQQLNETARKDAGATYATYLRAKISGAVDRLGTTACAVCSYPVDASHAMLVRAVVRCWAEEEELFADASEPSPAQIEFLRDFDLDYGNRRLQFVLAGLNAWYERLGEDGIPSRQELDAVKARLWQAIEQLRDAMSGQRFTPELTGHVSGCFPAGDVGEFVREHGLDPPRYVERRRGELTELAKQLRGFLHTQLEGFSARLYADLIPLTAGWTWERRQELLVRYLGFPLWDVVLYPLTSSADAGERDGVEVVRMSPRDSKLLNALGERKLEGVGLGHFRAFFERRYRENDYLWGRLDGAERLISLVLGKDHPDFRRWCGRAFQAILDEDGEALTLVQPLVEDLRRQADALARDAAQPAAEARPAPSAAAPA